MRKLALALFIIGGALQANAGMIHRSPFLNLKKYQSYKSVFSHVSVAQKITGSGAYRVIGVLVRKRGPSALIMLPNSNVVLVKKGDSLGNGVVKSISIKGVTIATSSGTVFLSYTPPATNTTTNTTTTNTNTNTNTK